MTAPDHPGVALYLRRVHDGEVALERHLHKVAERHHADHEIHHVAIDLARWSLENRRALIELAPRYGEKLDADQEPEDLSGPGSFMREKAAAMLGRRPEPGLLLVDDLRELYLMASGNSVYWTILGQAAQAAHDQQLLDVVTNCHSKTMRQVVWCNATIKTLSPQALLAV
jgi:hypothetical protein